MRGRNRFAGLRGRGLGAASAAAWSPADLAGLAPTLLPALSRTQGKLWQDSGKTIPATEDGDPVRVATCPFLGVDWTAPSASARPLLWDEGGGKWSLSFDGVDDTLSVNPLVVPQPLTLALVYTQDSQSGQYYTAGHGDVCDLVHNSDVQSRVYAGASVTWVDSYPLAWNATVVTYNGAASSVVRDETVLSSANPGTGGLGRFDLMSYTGVGYYSAGRVAGNIIVGAVVSGADLSSLRSYLAAVMP